MKWRCPEFAFLGLAGLLISAGSGAGSIDAGLALYTANCIGCHGAPPNGLKIGLLAAANNPALLLQQIKTNPAMQFLSSLSDSDLTNIASYIANPLSSDADCLLGWGETSFPALLTPRTFSITAAGFDYRYYPPTNVYVGINTPAPNKQRHLYYLDAKTSAGLIDLGDIGTYLATALAAGCP